MAQKRMFDKSIIETDKFSDLPMPTKALYFLLGMEADDEGFVSPKRVMRIYGGNDDDLKLLIAKNFAIPFESGVVVITDWHKNNWLDARRIKPTEYKEEKAKLALQSGAYVPLSERLASAPLEERRIEEKSSFSSSKKTSSFRRKDEDSYEDNVIDLDTGEEVTEPQYSDKSTYAQMIKWAQKRRGNGFRFSSVPKQYRALKMIKQAGRKPGEVKNKWIEMEEDDYWGEKGFDFMNVCNEFNKK